MAEAGPIDPFVVDLNNYQSATDFYQAVQNTLYSYGEEFSTYVQAVWGRPMANFLDSGPGLEGMDDWRAVRGLGEGGFGRVGLWQKLDENGEVVDDMAIKEVTPEPGQESRLDTKPTMAKEAAIMKQLNDIEGRADWSTSILRLRCFKYFTSSRTWRFYLENATYGDIWKIIYMYRAWQQHMPEDFLLHCFYGLSRAVKVMSSDQFTDLDSGFNMHQQVIHFDIKPPNIYMAKRSDQSSFTNYPSIKLADYGLSELTHIYERRNPIGFLWKGTPGCQPPEQNGFTAGWARCPGPEPIRDDSGFARDTPFLSTHNVWAVGKVMYDMMTLSYPDALGERMEAGTSEGNYYNQLDEHAIPEIQTSKRPEYSKRLRDLIRYCLHLDPRKRPTPDDLLSETQAAVAEAARNSAVPFQGDRVFYMGHEINHMERGSAAISMKRADFEAIRRDHWPEPSLEPLLSGRWAREVIDGKFVDKPIVEGGPKRERPLFPLDASVTAKHYGRRVRWVLHPPSRSEGLANRVRAQGGDDDDDDNQPPKQPTGPAAAADADQVPLRLLTKDGTRGSRNPDLGQRGGPGSVNGERQDPRQDIGPTLSQATNWAANQAAAMVHPRGLLNYPIPVQQPVPARQQRQRVLGLSLDAGVQAVEGVNRGGHNLRRRAP